MRIPGRARPARLSLQAAALALAGVAACAPGGLKQDRSSPWAPGVALNAAAEDGTVVGNRLMAAGEYELAIDAFTRAALESGITPEILTGMGSANLGLGRLGQAENQLRQAVKAAPDWPEAMNNLGVVLLERGKTAEAAQVLHRAYALDNGESDAIRDNLRLALAKMENSVNTDSEDSEFNLVQQSGGSYLIRKAPF